MHFFSRKPWLFLFLFISIIAPNPAKAEEGMWLPLLVSKNNITDMQRMGLKLSADQIYSVNQACLKDAIVALDHGGCSGSIISEKGLLITNHHCGFDDIAGQSSVENDYLTEGFWAMRPEEELPIPGKTVSFLLRMEDVTAAVLKYVNSAMSEEERTTETSRAIDSLVILNTEQSGYEVTIESMFQGNEYYLFVYETFNDIRMVGAPPSGIGKFGGETDNWMWPRHTGDFCLLRVYASPEGKPAAYDKKNLPYKAKYTLPVSIAGIREGDFTMIMGYPGMTDRYLTSYGVRQKMEQLNPNDILLKTAKMDILRHAMNQSDALRIAYAADFVYLANFQKKAIQESKALQRLRVADDKKAQEEKFVQWVNLDPERRIRYGKVIPSLEKVYETKVKEKADIAIQYLEETLMGAKALYWAYETNELVTSLEEGEDMTEQISYFSQRAGDFYKNYHAPVDKEIFIKMLTLYRENLPEEFHPEFFQEIRKKYRNDIRKYADVLYENSIYTDKERFERFLAKPRLGQILKDPVFRAANSFFASYVLAKVIQLGYEDEFNQSRRLLISGLREMQPEKLFYPDANSTMRLTYGRVLPYDPADAVKYHYQTSVKGILEKEDPSNPEFKVPASLRKLIESRDFGRYAEQGNLPVCFLATLDITGGNSGSPVMNDKGELIGVAFDGNSEAMSSDIKYDPQLQRTICVDMRYVLFVIEKVAGAGYLVEEMVVKEGR